MARYTRYGEMWLYTVRYDQMYKVPDAQKYARNPSSNSHQNEPKIDTIQHNTCNTYNTYNTIQYNTIQYNFQTLKLSTLKFSETLLQILWLRTFKEKKNV